MIPLSRYPHDDNVFDVEMFDSVFNGAHHRTRFEACVTAGTSAATFLITNKSPGLQCRRIAGSTLRITAGDNQCLRVLGLFSDSKYWLFL